MTISLPKTLPPAPKSEFFPLSGGMDVVTPRLIKKPGAIIAGVNFEPSQTGYTRIAGYERFDGHPSPSDSQYWLLDFVDGIGASAPASGDLIKGATATAMVVSVVTEAGNWAAASAGMAFTSLDSLTSVQLAAYSETQLNALTSVGLASLAGTQLNGLGSAALSGLAATQLNGLRWEQLVGMSNTQLDGITSSQLASLSDTQLYGLSSSHIAGLTGVQLGGLTSSDLGKASGYFVITNLSGAWVPNEAIKTDPGGVTLATSVGSPLLAGADTDALNTTYLRAAIDLARTKISPITGSGPIRGGHVFEGDVYAFRDNAGGTAGVMWKATAAGWVAQSLGYSLSFTNGGPVEIQEGDSVAGAVSHATGVVGRVIIESGAWVDGDVAGRLILTSKTGTFQAEDIRVGVNYSVGLAALAYTQLDGLTSTALSTWPETQLSTLTSVGLSSLADTQLNGLTSGALFGLSATQLDGLRWGQISGLAAMQLDGLHSSQLLSMSNTQLQGITSAQLATMAYTQLGVMGDAQFVALAGTQLDHLTPTQLATIYAQQFSGLTSSQYGAVYAARIFGDATANTLPAGGRYECITENFYGASDRACMYGANGVGTAFEWDGSVFVPLITGMATDTPNHIAAHKNHLFLSFPGGSLQFSGIADPYAWTPLLGAGEIGIGQDITGLVSHLNTLMVAGKNIIKVLYGNDSNDWDLRPHSPESGVAEWTLQHLVSPIFLDGAGLREFAASQSYGDMGLGTLSQAIEPILIRKAKRGFTPTASTRVNDKNQYRLFFSDGSGIAMYLVGSKPQIMPLDYSVDGVAKVVRCAFSGEDSSGAEVLFFGSDDGYLYQADKGGSFDGGTLSAFLRTAYFHAKSPQIIKRWHDVVFETDAPPVATLRLHADFDYAGEDTVSSDMASFTLRGGGGVWGEAYWGEFYWGGATESTITGRIKGRGTSVSFVISTESVYDDSFSINGATVSFSYLKAKR